MTHALAESTLGYANDEHGQRRVTVKSVREQVNRLNQIWPNVWITIFNHWKLENCHTKVEGLFVIPWWNMINPKWTYGQTIEEMFRKLREQYDGKFENHCTEQPQLGQIKHSDHSRFSLGHAAIYQRDSDYIVVPGQFGSRYSGKSVKNILSNIEGGEQGEFALGAWAVGILLLTHPELFNKIEERAIECGGDYFDRHGIRMHPRFIIKKKTLIFTMDNSEKVQPNFGIPTAWKKAKNDSSLGLR